MSGPFLVLLLVLAIAFIIFATARIRMHPFLVLLVTAYGFGLLAGLPAAETIKAITGGFGGTIGNIGIVIAAGTIIGFVLEKSGGAWVMATTVIGWVGQARSALAMSITGAIVSIPVFCDSGFVILSSLARSLAVKAKESMALYAVALSLGLYATHVFVPPTPGPIAAAGTLNADIGTVMLMGLVVTVPVVFVSYLFATFMGRRIYIDPERGEQVAAHLEESAHEHERELPTPLMAFAPIVVPIILIAVGSVAQFPTRPLGEGAVAALLAFLGNPNTALILGVFLAFLTVRERGPEVYG
nr:GntP family permease [Pseudomonadota bacterium]